MQQKLATAERLSKTHRRRLASAKGSTSLRLDRIILFSKHGSSSHTLIVFLLRTLIFHDANYRKVCVLSEKIKSVRWTVRAGGHSAKIVLFCAIIRYGSKLAMEVLFRRSFSPRHSSQTVVSSRLLWSGAGRRHILQLLLRRLYAPTARLVPRL